jgi:hypothetical protein
MPTDLSPRTTAFHVARAILLVVGLALSTVSFVGLLDKHLVLARVGYLPYLGLIGLAAMLVGLGSPWRERAPVD